MTLSHLLYKLKKRIWHIIVKNASKTYAYPLIYRSFWHMLLNKSIQNDNGFNYLTAVPNRGAGIGHQLANWIAGYWFANKLGLHFAHTPFSTQKWDDFLGFGNNELSVDELMSKGYKKVLLPLFDESNSNKFKLVERIIKSYNDRKVVFVTEQDQFYKDQYGVMHDMQSKFYNASSRKSDRLIYSENNFNIAIHVRRGDIVVGKEGKNANLQMRWQDNNYFVNILTNVLKNINSKKPIAIYLFSQGTPGDFREFDSFENLHFCMNMGAEDSFLHMVYADLLITSKSSFSYKPALLNKGIKVCPRNFWHSYPATKDWVMVEDNGEFENKTLQVFTE